ncbi:hypothetical protein OC861_002435 [Tilletia horrida]|nr:hypothetical protein OC861_002435 [Tilletia horrida]
MSQQSFNNARSSPPQNHNFSISTQHLQHQQQLHDQQRQRQSQSRGNHPDSNYLQTFVRYIFPCCVPSHPESSTAQDEYEPQSSSPWSFDALLSTLAKLRPSRSPRSARSGAADERTPLLSAADTDNSAQSAGEHSSRLHVPPADPETRQQLPAVPLNPDLLRKITQTTQQNFLAVALSGPYAPEEVDHRSATSGGGVGHDRRSAVSAGGAYDRRSAYSGTALDRRSAHSVPGGASAAFPSFTALPGTTVHSSTGAGSTSGTGTLAGPTATASPANTQLSRLTQRSHTSSPSGRQVARGTSEAMSDLQRSTLAKLEAESILSGPLVETWKDG